MIHAVVSAPYAENTYLLHHDRDCVIVDPGFEPQKILDAIAKHNLNPVAIFNTHGHEDHIAGNAAMKKAFPNIPLMIGRGDAPMLLDPVLNLSAFHGPPVVSPAADRLLDDSDVLELAGFRFTVRNLFGHSPGHVVFIETDFVLGGDVLFRGSIGRTDFPGGSLDQLLNGIRTVLWPLNDEVIVYPGHGPETTVGHEKRTNPFLN